MAPTTGQVITCQAAVCWAAGEPLVVQEVQVDPPQAGEVRIKIVYVSLCHTDVTLWEDKLKIGLFPRIFGHEAAGIVESVGEGVIDLQEGDHVLPVFIGECKDCRVCRSERGNNCEKLQVDIQSGVMSHDNRSRFSINGKPIYSCLGSTFSQYTVIESAKVVKINAAAPLEKVCVLSCGVTTGMSSVWNVAKVEKNSTVAIFGLGTIGLAVAEAARRAGASQIIGVDINSSKSDKARVLGITDFINPKDHDKPLHQVIVDMTKGGVDYSFECVGSAKLMEIALLSCHDGIGMTIVCGVATDMTPFSVHPRTFLNGRTLCGTLFGGLKPKSQLPEVVEMFLRKEFLLDEFITHKLPISKINDSFKLMLEGNCLRCVMHF